MDLHVSSFLTTITIITCGFAGYMWKIIDLAGSVTGILLAIVIWHGTGHSGLVALFLFFVTGSIVSSWKKVLKETYHLAEGRGGMRGMANVLANGGVAGIISAVAILFGLEGKLPEVLVLASFAAACSDTFSSELGNAFGSRFVDVLSWKRSERGPDGVISAEGTIFGLVGSLLIGGSYYFFNQDFFLVFTITASGFIGNVVDSFAGATLQRKGFLDNHQVNLAATGTSALAALVFWGIFH